VIHDALCAVARNSTTPSSAPIFLEQDYIHNNVCIYNHSSWYISKTLVFIRKLNLLIPTITLLDVSCINMCHGHVVNLSYTWSCTLLHNIPTVSAYPTREFAFETTYHLVLSLQQTNKTRIAHLNYAMIENIVQIKICNGNVTLIRTKQSSLCLRTFEWPYFCQFCFIPP